MIQAPWHVVARAEVTKRLAHGDRVLETRVFLADGRIMEQINPGVPDLENDWREVGRFDDLRVALRDLRKQGWQVQRPPAALLWARAILTFAVIAVLASVMVYLALAR